jgi:hypothetical protein
LFSDFDSSSLSSDDYQIGISPGRYLPTGNKEAYLWFPVSEKGPITSDLIIGTVATTGLYRVEVKIPWSVLKITPYKGMRLGFALGVSDNDDDSIDVQQSMISNISTRDLTDPTKWGELILD